MLLVRQGVGKAAGSTTFLAVKAKIMKDLKKPLLA
jgi:hypothetical protein